MKIWEQVDSIFLAENNAPYSPDISNIVKKLSVEESAQFFIDKFNLPLSTDYIINRIKQIAAHQYHHSIPLKPFVKDYLDTLRSCGIPCCIATATYRSLADAALNRLGIADYFNFILTCSDLGVSKSLPDIFLSAAFNLGYEPSDIAVFEDSLHCVQTAKNAGFYVVGIFDEASAADWPLISHIADANILSFKELLPDES